MCVDRRRRRIHRRPWSTTMRSLYHPRTWGQYRPSTPSTSPSKPLITTRSSPRDHATLGLKVPLGQEMKNSLSWEQGRVCLGCAIGMTSTWHNAVYLFCSVQGSHASWKVPDFLLKISGPGKSWKLKLKVLEKYRWKSCIYPEVQMEKKQQ